MKRLAAGLFCFITVFLPGLVSAELTPITGNHVFFNVSNDSGVKFNWDAAKYGDAVTNDNQYYILADGGGLNQLHVTTDPSNAYGGVTGLETKSSSISGTFYVSTTGGRGFNDDIILLASVKGPIRDDFSLHIKSSGYSWEVNNTYNILPTVYSYVEGALDHTFTKDDFKYGPQTVKPGPIREGTLPLIYGQDFNDPSTAQYLMFIDLYLGNFTKPSLIAGGDVRIDYTFTGLDSVAAFNPYAWAGPGKDAQGVNWTTRTNGIPTTSSGYSITYTGAPVPVPAAIWLFGSGMSGMFFIRRKNRK